MAQTPEGKIKEMVKKVLDECKLAGYTYYNFPVPSGYGTPMLDVVGCHHGVFFAVETKAPGKKPTPRQLFCIEEMHAAGGAVFVIDGPGSLEKLEEWLDTITNSTSQQGTPSTGDTR
tara:strand:+ start:1263 stop:1613 length:351 start_codon:yes stop_codon:yes gene_type:complete